MTNKFHNVLGKLALPLNLLLLSGCATYGNISNEKFEVAPSAGYSIRQSIHIPRTNEVSIVLAFSGGGTRAAALAYGVLKTLRETTVHIKGKPRVLLDEVDMISAVSGGSFTAAYYGLRGDGLFYDFEDRFLRRNVTDELMHGLFSPSLWFSNRGRTEMSINYYQENLFKGATFADLERQQGPLIVINASDLGSGVRFSFVQDYFDLLCSDLSTFPVARAVAASSAVPVLFNPVVLKNHPGCKTRTQKWLAQKRHLTSGSQQMSRMVNALLSYEYKDDRPFIHLVDGGVTDNLGLLTIYEMFEVAGGARQLLDTLGGKPTPYFIVILVNASTTPKYEIEASNKIPKLEDIINAVSDIQVHRYNDVTLDLLRSSMKRWSAELSTPEKPVTPYFVEIDFASIPQAERRMFFNRIPTNFSLKQEQVDNLIAVGSELLLSSTEYQRFIRDLGNVHGH